MSLTANISDNNALAALSRRAGASVTGAIRTASNATGVDFSYLMQQASAESSFDTDAKASTSSASGLYQFIEKTWLHMVKDYGAQYGMAREAAQIDDNGNVADPAAKQKILALRDNPQKAAAMAAEFARQNRDYLEQNYSGKVGATELYFAHFMGAGGASAFLNAYQDNKLQNAADLFPKAANANRNVFYDSQTGKARTLAGVYDFFAKKFGESGTETGAAPETGSTTSNSLLAGSHAAKPDLKLASAAARIGDANTVLRALSGDSSFEDTSATTAATALQAQMMASLGTQDSISSFAESLRNKDRGLMDALNIMNNVKKTRQNAMDDRTLNAFVRHPAFGSLQGTTAQQPSAATGLMNNMMPSTIQAMILSRFSTSKLTENSQNT